MDRFGETARKGFDFLKNRALETVEVTKLSAQIRELEGRRDGCLLDLGHRVMAMVDSPAFDKEALRDRVEEVRTLNSEIEAAKRELEETKASLKHSVEEILPSSRSVEPPQTEADADGGEPEPEPGFQPPAPPTYDSAS